MVVSHLACFYPKSRRPKICGGEINKKMIGREIRVNLQRFSPINRVAVFSMAKVASAIDFIFKSFPFTVNTV
jgi:hypothetical protein